MSFNKYLAVIIDENINFKYEINFVISKFSVMCGILYRIRNNLTQETLLSIQYTLCYPHLKSFVSVFCHESTTSSHENKGK